MLISIPNNLFERVNLLVIGEHLISHQKKQANRERITSSICTFSTILCHVYMWQLAPHMTHATTNISSICPLYATSPTHRGTP